MSLITVNNIIVVTFCSKWHRLSLSLIVVNGITLMVRLYIYQLQGHRRTDLFFWNMFWQALWVPSLFPYAPIVVCISCHGYLVYIPVYVLFIIWFQKTHWVCVVCGYNPCKYFVPNVSIVTRGVWILNSARRNASNLGIHPIRLDDWMEARSANKQNVHVVL